MQRGKKRLNTPKTTTLTPNIIFWGWGQTPVPHAQRPSWPSATQPPSRFWQLAPWCAGINCEMRTPVGEYESVSNAIFRRCRYPSRSVVTGQWAVGGQSLSRHSHHDCRWLADRTFIYLFITHIVYSVYSKYIDKKKRKKYVYIHKINKKKKTIKILVDQR